MQKNTAHLYIRIILSQNHILVEDVNNYKAAVALIEIMIMMMINNNNNKVVYYVLVIKSLNQRYMQPLDPILQFTSNEPTSAIHLQPVAIYFRYEP